MQHLFDSWRVALWKSINVDEIELEVKRMLNFIRSLDKHVRSWDAYAGLDSALKNMV